MGIQLPVVAGGVSTVIFAASTLPMLVKAGRTKNLSSYSLGNIVLSNVGTRYTRSTCSTFQRVRSGCCTPST